MKNYLITGVMLVMIITSTQVNAQSFGVKAGLNLSNMSYQYNSVDQSDYFSWKPGFHLGATFEIPIGKVISINPELSFTQKGHKVEDYFEAESGGYEYYQSGHTSLNYFELPVTVKASFDVGKIQLYAFAGPYVAVGVGGKYDYEITEVGYNHVEVTEYKTKVKWGNNSREDNCRRGDIGLLVGSGIGIRSLRISLAYSAGLYNIGFEERREEIANKNISLSVGLKFGNK